MHAEVGLFLLGVGTALILVALTRLIWSMQSLPPETAQKPTARPDTPYQH
jgi:hypothetical protein